MQTSVFSKKFLGLPGKETFFLAHLHAQETFRNNVSLFAGALIPLKYQAPTVDYEFHAPLRTEGQVRKHKSEGAPI